MSSGASTPGSAPKSMSSRLLTMKFMQRAAASSPTTPTPPTPDEPSPKRRKKDSDSWSPSSPGFDVNALADQRAIQAALAADEAKKEAALERAAHESGDTRWVLSFEDQRASSSSSPKLALRVVQTGYASLDVPSVVVEGNIDEDKPVMMGRRSFGKFNKVLEKKQDGEELESSSEDDEDEDSEEEYYDDDPASELIRQSRQEAVARAKEVRKKKKREEHAESEKLAKKRKKESPTVNLNGLTSLSGRAPNVVCHNCGGPHFVKDCTQPKKFKGACHRCGGPHLIKDCPQPGKRGYHGGDDGPPRKAIKSR